MPKYIENLRQKLMDEARDQIQRSGYGGVSIRSIANGCGVGVGTVYNYFPSKDALLASFMLADWNQCVATIEAVSQDADAPDAVTRCIYDSLVDFSRLHNAIICDETASTAFAGAFGKYHGMLRSQLAKPLGKFCADTFVAEFIAEAMLSWTMAGKPYEELNTQIKKLFKE